ncbi:DUF7144 family membrane protein [Streptomyces sp. NPDC004288]|uniref:DUF7144 family membrane protein n=1 Tax=unclassified Streptomyces TaxID=2593676 RepID=UPI002E79F3F5|nr:hypothetical protein [Streptomyces sp. SP18ES09]MEE1815586.1 hypothetical protein [Streptomyces sp. SP18ES09]
MTSTHSGHTSSAKYAWAGGLRMFAAVMLALAGLLGIFRGIMAIAKDDVFVTTPDYVFQFDVTGWGWIHLCLGIVALLVSFGLFGAAAWARYTGIGIAALVVIANFLSLPYYPWWSVIMIAMSGFIIWALCVDPADAGGGSGTGRQS